MEKILVFDNVLDDDELKEALSRTQLSHGWSYGHISEYNEAINTPFWVLQLGADNFFNDTLLKKIQTLTNKNFEILYVYANGQTYGQNGNFHIDEEEEGCYTFCLYISNYVLNKETQNVMYGDLQFKIPNLDERLTLCVSNTTNRGVFFPSNYVHRGTSFGRYIPGLRISIAWKLKEIRKNYTTTHVQVK